MKTHMGIERGERWGTSAVLPRDSAVCADDASAAAHIGALLGGGQPVVALKAGDLCATLGGRGDVADRLGSDAQLLPCDLGVAEASGVEHLFVAHCLLVPSPNRRVGRLPWLRGPLIAAMNAAWLGPWNVAPRAHPGDGRLDVVQVDARMGLPQRLEALRRLPHGGHVPHPSVTVRRTRSSAPVEIALDRPLHLVLDGQDRGRVDRVTFSTIDDAFLAAV